MNKLIPATLAVTAVLAFPGFAGETTITAVGTTTTPVAVTTTTVKTDNVVAAPAVAPVPAGSTGTVTTTTTTAAPAAMTSTTVTTEEDATPEESKIETYTLQDGTTVTVIDKKAYTVEKDGSKKPAPDGIITTKDGIRLQVRDGMLVTDTVPGAATVNTNATGNVVTPAPATGTAAPAATGHAPQE